MPSARERHFTFAASTAGRSFFLKARPPKRTAVAAVERRLIRPVHLAIAAAANLSREDWVLSYQSRVGPMKWIGPSTENEIRRAGAEGKALVVLPIAFVSEHSETLVELDIEYAALAREVGVPLYLRVPTVGTQPEFIEGLARLVREAHRFE